MVALMQSVVHCIIEFNKVTNSNLPGSGEVGKNKTKLKATELEGCCARSACADRSLQLLLLAWSPSPAGSQSIAQPAGRSFVRAGRLARAARNAIQQRHMPFYRLWVCHKIVAAAATGRRRKRGRDDGDGDGGQRRKQAKSNKKRTAVTPMRKSKRVNRGSGRDQGVV